MKPRYWIALCVAPTILAICASCGSNGAELIPDPVNPQSNAVVTLAGLKFRAETAMVDLYHDYDRGLISDDGIVSAEDDYNRAAGAVYQWIESLKVALITEEEADSSTALTAQEAAISFLQKAESSHRSVTGGTDYCPSNAVYVSLDRLSPTTRRPTAQSNSGRVVPAVLQVGLCAEIASFVEGIVADVLISELDSARKSNDAKRLALQDELDEQNWTPL